jgi:hypothetical protein
MPTLTCKTCGGEYSRELADGLRYFHACPPTDQATPGVFVARANARNENIDPAKVRASQDESGRRKPTVTDDDLIIAVGAGVTVRA